MKKSIISAIARPHSFVHVLSCSPARIRVAKQRIQRLASLVMVTRPLKPVPPLPLRRPMSPTASSARQRMRPGR
jgi:hypothetical protein